GESPGPDGRGLWAPAVQSGMDFSSESDDMMQRIASLLPFLVGAAGLHAQDARYEVEKHKNLSYNPARTADPVRHKLDLYVPKGVKDFPALMFVHGGGWRSGTKALYGPLGGTFAKRGSGTAAINYRRTDSK